MSNELITIEQETVLAVFSQEGGLNPVIEQARQVVAGFEHDMSTAASRKRTASLANKVAKLKVKLDDMGKDLVSDWKAKSKLVDASRKHVRDELDALKAEARKPLTEWEAEQAEIERLEAEKKLREEIERDHEIALLMDAEFNRQLAEKLAEEKRLEDERQAKLEQERLEREEEIKRQAAEQARLEAERKAKEEAERVEREKQEAIEREQRAIEAQKEAERQRIAAEERAKLEAEQAELRRIEAEKQAKIDAEKAAEAARLAEIERQRQEQEAIAAEEAKRAADLKHRKAINNAALRDLVDNGLTEDQAKLAITAIAKGLIAHIGIKY